MLKQFKPWMVPVVLFSLANLSAMSPEGDQSKKRKRDEISQDAQNINNHDYITDDCIDDGEHKKVKLDEQDDEAVQNNNNNIINLGDVEQLIQEGKRILGSSFIHQFNDENETVIEFDPAQGIKIFTSKMKNPEYQKEDMIWHEPFEVGEKVIILDCGHILSLVQKTDDEWIEKTLDEALLQNQCPNCRNNIDKNNPGGHIIWLENDVEFVKFLLFTVPVQHQKAVWSACRNKDFPESWNALIDKYARSSTTMKLAQKLLELEKDLMKPYVDMNGEQTTLLSAFIKSDFRKGFQFVMSKCSALLFNNANVYYALLLRAYEYKSSKTDKNHFYIDSILGTLTEKIKLLKRNNAIVNIFCHLINKQKIALGFENKNCLWLISQFEGSSTDQENSLSEEEKKERMSLFKIFVACIHFLPEDVLNMLVTKIGKDIVQYASKDDSIASSKLSYLIDFFLARSKNNHDYQKTVLELIAHKMCRPYLEYSIKSTHSNNSVTTTLLKRAVEFDCSWALELLFKKCRNLQDLILSKSVNLQGQGTLLNFAFDKNNSCLKVLIDKIKLDSDQCIGLLNKIIQGGKSFDKALIESILSKLDNLSNDQKTKLFLMIRTFIAPSRKGFTFCSKPEDDIACIQNILEKIGSLDQVATLENILLHVPLIHMRTNILALLLKHRMPVKNGDKIDQNTLVSFLSKIKWDNTIERISHVINRCVELLMDYGADSEKKVNFSLTTNNQTSKVAYSACDICNPHVDIEAELCKHFSISEPYLLPGLRGLLYQTLKYYLPENPEYFDGNGPENIIEANNNNNSNSNNDNISWDSDNNNNSDNNDNNEKYDNADVIDDK